MKFLAGFFVLGLFSLNAAANVPSFQLDCEGFGYMGGLLSYDAETGKGTFVAEYQNVAPPMELFTALMTLTEVKRSGQPGEYAVFHFSDRASLNYGQLNVQTIQDDSGRKHVSVRLDQTPDRDTQYFQMLCKVVN